MNQTNFPNDGLSLQDYITSAVYITVCSIGLFGNGITMAVVLFNPKMKTASNIYIFNLALSDFIFLLSLPTFISHIFLKQWIFGEFMCKLHYGCFGVTLFTGVYTITAMSCDRYIAVCKSKWHNYRTLTNSILCCVAVWTVSFLLMVPLLLYSFSDGKNCLLDFPNGGATIFIIYTVIFSFFLPLTLITTFYSLILHYLRKHSLQMLIRNQDRTRRVTLLVLGIILCYLVCWLPYWIIQLMFLAHSQQPDEKLPSSSAMIAYHTATILYHANSMLNPLLYGFLSSNFRKGFTNLFRSQSKLTSERKTYNGSNLNHNSMVTSKKKSLQVKDCDHLLSKQETLQVGQSTECNSRSNSPSFQLIASGQLL